MELTLREYREGDLEAMYALDVACFAPVFRFSERSMLRFAEAEGAVTVLAFSGAGVSAELAGFCIAEMELPGAERYGYVVTLDVAPGWRRQGLAGRLMAEVEKKVAAEGGLAMELHVFAGNEGAVRFYERAGYERVGAQMGFYGQGLDGLVYGKRLGRGGEELG